MDEEYIPSEYQKELIKYGILCALIRELRHIGHLISESESTLSMCDEDFMSSDLSKKLNSFSDSALELTTILSSMRYRIINKEENNEQSHSQRYF